MRIPKSPRTIDNEIWLENPQFIFSTEREPSLGLRTRAVAGSQLVNRGGEVRWLESLSNQFLTLPPQILGGFVIECVGTNAFTHNTQLLVLRHDLAHVAILTITSPDLVSRRNKAGPDRRRRPLRNRLVLERPFAFCS